VIRLIGAPQHYAWGSPTAIPAAIGEAADGRPWAELWWGTHPGGATRTVDISGAERPLAEVAGALPFLVKLLAAERPLSLQAHPSDVQAAVGFEREERLGVPRSAPHRVYRDPLGKPELIVAITPFEALCGFRPVEEVAAELSAAGGSAVADRLRTSGPLDTVAWLLTERPAIRLDHPVFRELDTAYPGDPGAIVATLLRRVSLEPGEGLFLGAGMLHMYLHGIGLEVMGSSDNVMRGGLTEKHVDVAELVGVLTDGSALPLTSKPDPHGWYRVDTGAFAVQGLAGPDRWVASGPEIVVKLDGAGGTTAWFVPAGEVVDWTGGLGCRVCTGRR
jgi:mannose-6-phosphate isomerase